MIRYGAQAQDMRTIQESDIFKLRLRLLIIMTKAYLKGNPLGDFRKDAIIDTAHFIFYEALFQSSQLQNTNIKGATQSTTQSCQRSPDHIFLQRVQLLAVMATAIAKGSDGGNYRKRAMADNIDLI